jgi:hypothetical protein
MDFITGGTANRTRVSQQNWASDLVSVILETVGVVDLLGLAVGLAESALLGTTTHGTLLLGTLDQLVEVNLLATFGQLA